MPEKQVNEAPKASIKDYTLEIPMIDLKVVAEFVGQIRDQGLETASMKAAALKFDYAAATSTPFYRRIVAARLFGLLPKSGLDLTPRATAYLKPDDENAKTAALGEAIIGIPAYAENIQKLSGKKLNLELISNGFETKLKITAPAAKICAKVFEDSLRFAGFLAEDGTVFMRPGAAVVKPPTVIKPDRHDEKVDEDSRTTQTHTLYFDEKKARMLTVTAPLDIKQSELTRITNWLKYALVVTGLEENDNKESPAESA